MRTTIADRVTGTTRFYGLLDLLATRTNGPRILRECSGRMGWPRRGVYFFFEAGENRTDHLGKGRVVRVGTHAVTARSDTSLWNRLSQHRGVKGTGLGNHRGSIFRLILGTALAEASGMQLPSSWGVGNSASQAAHRLGSNRNLVKAEEAELERQVSQYIGQMPFLWLNVPDEPGPDSARGYIERNTIALLSGCISPAIDLPSEEWLGHYSDRDQVRRSGLWNNRHVDETWDPTFLEEMESLIVKMTAS